MAMTLVSTTTVGATSVSSIEFTGIPQTGKDLIMTTSLRSSHSGVVDVAYIQVNNNTSAIYSSRRLSILGTTTTNGSNPNESTLYAIFMNGNTSTSSMFDSAQTIFSNYTASTNKSVSIESTMENDASTHYMMINSGFMATTAPITSIKLTSLQGQNFLQHSTVSLYIVS